MTDLIKVAMDRRAELQEEVSRLSEFIRMGENLARSNTPRAEVERPMPSEKPTDATADRANVFRRNPAQASG